MLKFRLDFGWFCDQFFIRFCNNIIAEFTTGFQTASKTDQMPPWSWHLRGLNVNQRWQPTWVESSDKSTATLLQNKTRGIGYLNRYLCTTYIKRS